MSFSPAAVVTEHPAAFAFHVFVDYCVGEGVHMWQVAKLAMASKWTFLLLPSSTRRMLSPSCHAQEVAADGIVGVRTALNLCWHDAFGTALQARN